MRFRYFNRQLFVVCLEIHLDDHYTLYYHERNEQTVAGRERPGTKIAGWFESNKLHPTARRLLYYEYAIYFTWNRSAKR